jgi:hypothetical protein
MAEPATARQANTLLSPTALPMSPHLAPPPPPLSQSPQPAPLLPALSTQLAPLPRKLEKTVSEATRAGSWAAVLAYKRQIPQLDGRFLPPTTPGQQRSRYLSTSSHRMSHHPSQLCQRRRPSHQLIRSKSCVMKVDLTTITLDFIIAPNTICIPCIYTLVSKTQMESTMINRIRHQYECLRECRMNDRMYVVRM